MPLLVSRFGNHGLDPASTQVRSNRARRVGLVAPDSIRACAWPTYRALNAEHLQHWQQHWRIPSLAGRDHGDQRETVAVDELMDLRREAPA